MTKNLRFTSSSIFLISLMISGFLFAELQLVDRIAAVVNQDVVLVSELNARTSEIKKRYASNTSVLPADNILDKQVLDQLILELL